MKYYAGLNFGDAFIKCSIVARDGTLLCRDKITCSKVRASEEAVGDMIRLISMLKQRANVVLSGVGIVISEMADCLSGFDEAVASRLAVAVQEQIQSPVRFVSGFDANDFNAEVFGGL